MRVPVYVFFSLFMIVSSQQVSRHMIGARVPIFFATHSTHVALDIVVGSDLLTERTVLRGPSSPGKVMIGGFGPNSRESFQTYTFTWRWRSNLYTL